MGSKFYITTAIDYTNGKPHIGHALEKVEADVLARYHRVQGDDVFFLTGTDEHGAKIVLAAETAGKNPQEFTDTISEKFRNLKDILNLSWDDFIRTTDQKRHWPGVVGVWEKLVASGDIYKKQYTGLYCVGHEAFVTQKDLVDGKCGDHGTEPEVVEEENYFFQLSKYAKEIESKIESDELKIIPEARKNEILSFIRNEGLEDVSFSRPRKDLSWGIPVPEDETQTIYVWADALTNYLSAIGYPDEKFKKWWPPDVQVIGKDILRFHAAIWPAMLLSLSLPIPKTLLVHGFITVDGKKMSKTIGNIADPFEIIERLIKSGVPKESATDALRYYLLREISTGGDGDFSWEKFGGRYNADLANGLGNLVSRVMKMATVNGISYDEEKARGKIQNITNIDPYKMGFSEYNLQAAIAYIWGEIEFANKYIQKKEPFKKIKTNPEEAKDDINSLLYELVRIGTMLRPFLPETSEKILEAIKNNSEMKTPLFPRLQ